MSLSALLPAPRHYTEHAADPTSTGANEAVAAPARRFEPPAYGARVGFVPRTAEDFGDGGAFPEIHTQQYPLGMGKKEKKGAKGSSTALTVVSNTAVVPVSVDGAGAVQYDAIVKQGHMSHVVVHSGYSAMQAKNEAKMDLSKPSAEEEDRLAEETKKALGMIVEKKIATGMPTHVAKHSKEAVFIKYTPSEQNANFNSGAKQRIIRLQEMPVDPLQPPKFKHTKLPPGAPDAPVPVMHSPPRKITAEDQKAWQIPPCISNWKNLKGYTIPLDKRLAADGRGLQEVQVNDKFAQLAESLFIAQRTSRTEIEQRATLAKKMQRKAKEVQEEEFRNLANQARSAAHMETGDTREEETYDSAAAGTQRGEGQAAAAESTGRKPGEYRSDDEDMDEGREERDALRRDRQRDLKRDMRQEARKQEKGTSSHAREAERDVSEKIALGQAPAQSKDAMFDQRLFNQDAGLAAGFGAADDYDVYSKPLFSGSSTGNVYRPKAVEGYEEEGAGRGNLSASAAAAAAAASRSSTAKFAADRGFAGTEHGGAPGGARSKPVEFERDRAEADDPFGLGNLLNETRAKPNALDKIGANGPQMGLGREQASDKGRSIQFEEPSSSSSSRRDDRDRNGGRKRSRSRSRSRERRRH